MNRKRHVNCGGCVATILLMAALLLLQGGCRRNASSVAVSGNTSSAATDAHWFADITERSGLHFIHDAGPVGNYELPQIMGSGAALFDYDGDGRLDIYVVQNGGPGGSRNQLFHQEPDGTFRDVSAGSGLDVAGYGMGVAVADVNNDGLPDLLLCEYGGIRLFINNGDGTFTDATREAGLSTGAELTGIRPWPAAATFFDYDRDGWLDLAVASYVAYDPSRRCTDSKGKPDYCGPADFPGTITRIYHNLGMRNRGGTDSSAPRRGGIPRFEDVTSQAGLSTTPGPGLGIIAADFNGDGWPDLLVANDGRPNALWINRHDGSFANEAFDRGLAVNAHGQAQANMGIAIGDVNANGLFDIYITHLTDEYNALWLQGPRGRFTDATVAAGLVGHGQGTGFGTVLADFDLSGTLGLAAVNGRVLRSPRPMSEAQAPNLPTFWRAYAENNQLFASDGQGRFRDISSQNPAFCRRPNVARGLASGDIFNDGSISLLVTTVAGPARLYRNIAHRHGHWLEVRAILPAHGGRDACGALVELQAAGRRFVGQVIPGSSYMCSNDPRVHFGLGRVSHIDAIRITWPNGAREQFPATAADQQLTLRQGAGAAVR